MASTPRAQAEHELITVYEIGKILNSSLDIQKTFHESLNVLVTQLDFRRAMVVLKQSEQELSVFAAAGLTPEEAAGGHFRRGEGVIGRVFASGIAAVVPDIAAEPLFLNRTYSSRSPDTDVAFVAVPIRHGRERHGVLAVDGLRRQVGGFSATLRLLAVVSTLLGQRVSGPDGRADARDEATLAARSCAAPLDQIVGASAAMQALIRQVRQVGPSRSTVLLRGESGSGKEVIARAIHELSPRRGNAFIKVNGAALSESLLESELFGHEKGAFTGASSERKGRFEQAHGGTLFLDEIGDVSPAFQAKLLRVLQEREFERVGGNRSIKVDVRLICATHRNLEQMVVAGTFRADLYYRINVVSLFLPPLRERREDIPPLARHFLERYNRENGRTLRLLPDALQRLSHCDWPGNVRELENCIERSATMSVGDVIRCSAFPCQHGRCLSRQLQAGTVETAPAVPTAPPMGHMPEPATPPAQGERERLVWALENSGWIQTRAARLLNLTPRQIGYALSKYGITIQKY